MSYYVYNVKTDSCDFVGSYRECQDYISGYSKDEAWYLEIRGGN